MQSFIDLDLNQEGLSADFARLGHSASTRESLKSGLVKAKLMKEGDELCSFADITAWHRGGAETFVADSTLTTKSGESHHVIGKALVSFASSPDRILASWLRRRGQLERIGVRVPFLYSAFAGTIFEEFIEADVCQDSFGFDPLSRDVAVTAVLLDCAGFEPLSLLSDLRTRDQKVYYVDFGSDLGDPSSTPTHRARIGIERMLSEPYRSICLNYYESYRATLGGDSPFFG